MLSPAGASGPLVPSIEVLVNGEYWTGRIEPGGEGPLEAGTDVEVVGVAMRYNKYVDGGKSIGIDRPFRARDHCPLFEGITKYGIHQTGSPIQFNQDGSVP